MEKCIIDWRILIFVLVFELISNARLYITATLIKSVMSFVNFSR